jgi:hypothetical protein
VRVRRAGFAYRAEFDRFLRRCFLLLTPIDPFFGGLLLRTPLSLTLSPRQGTRSFRPRPGVSGVSGRAPLGMVARRCLTTSASYVALRSRSVCPAPTARTVTHSLILS